MQIDHPDWLFEPLCMMSGSVSFAEYERSLVKESRKGGQGIIKDKGSKSVEMHLYILTTLKLVEAYGENESLRYRRTPLGDKLCDLRGPLSSRSEYQKYLRSVLLRNKVIGPIFRQFLSIVNERFEKGKPATRDDIKELFRGETYRTLISLGKDAGLITVVNNFLRPRSAKQGNIVDMRLFSRLVRKSYSAFRGQREGAQPQTIYVEIARLRDVVLSIFGLTDEDANEKFDQAFAKLLDTKAGVDIHIHGAAPQFLPERSDPSFESRVFRYKGKIYVFMSIS